MTKRPLAYISAAWSGNYTEDTRRAANYCREVYDAGFSPICPRLYLPLFLNAAIDELSYLAALIDDMDKGDLARFAAAVEFGEHNGSVKELINLAQNLDCYELYPGIENEEDLGRYYIEEMCSMEVPEHLQNYIDYEAYGRDIYLDENGQFVNGGYIVDTGDSFIEHYDGREDIPDEHRIFAYPKPERSSISDTLKTYGRLIAEAPAAPERLTPAKADR